MTEVQQQIDDAISGVETAVRALEALRKSNPGSFYSRPGRPAEAGANFNHVVGIRDALRGFADRLEKLT